MSNYDSTVDTQTHIIRVRELLYSIINDLAARLIAHDASKLEEPEKSAFDKYTPALKGLTYGSEEYRACLRQMKPAIDHHYAHNSHHPEFHGTNGIMGMSLLDLIEMLADWRAAQERHADSSMEKSMAVNKDRFKIDDQLTQILWNTVKELKWL